MSTPQLTTPATNWPPQDFKLVSRVYVNSLLTCKVVTCNSRDPLSIERARSITNPLDDDADYTFSGTIRATPEVEPDQWFIEVQLGNPKMANTDVGIFATNSMKKLAQDIIDQAKEQGYQSDAVGVYTVVTQPDLIAQLAAPPVQTLVETVPAPVKNWAPDNYQLDSYVLTNVNGDSFVLSLNANDERSVEFTEQEMGEKYELGFAYAARIIAKPQEAEGEFWIEMEVISSPGLGAAPPIIEKILKAISTIAIAKVAQLGYPADKVVTWVANVRLGLEKIGDIPVTIH